MTTPSPPAGPPTDPGPRPRGAHRAESQSRSLLLPLIGVLGVLAALGLAGYMLLTSDNGEEEPDASPRPTATDTVDGEPSNEPSEEPSGDGTKEPSKEQTKEPTKEPTKDPGDKNNNKPTKNPNDPSVASVPEIPVYVFNQTTVSGLAAQTAQEFESVGWNIAGVGNWRGVVPEDTVYYYPGDRAAAQQLSNQFPDIARVWPASSPMRGGALTVILADTNRK